MATMIIREAVLRARHVQGDPDLARMIGALSPEETVVLRIEGRPTRFRKAHGGTHDGPADAVEPTPEDAGFWRQLLERRGAMITVERGTPSPDPYLLSLTATLSEWNGPDDAAAYDGL